MGVDRRALSASYFGKPIQVGTSMTLIHTARPGIDGTITGASSSGGAALFATSAVHGMAAGDRVYLSGFVTNTAYNSDWFVKTAPSTTTFTVTATGPPSSLGSALAFGSNEAGSFRWTSSPTLWDEVFIWLSNQSNQNYGVFVNWGSNTYNLPNGERIYYLPSFSFGQLPIIAVPGFILQGGYEVYVAGVGSVPPTGNPIMVDGYVNRYTNA